MIKTIVDRIIDVQLMMKSLYRKSKKCNEEERHAKMKAKNAYKVADVECARIYAETSVRKRKESQHYAMLNSHLSPILAQLKNEFVGRANDQDYKELQQLLDEVTTLGQQDNFNVSQNEINSFVQNLNNDQSPETSCQAPTAILVTDLEQRLANLRRKSP